MSIQFILGGTGSGKSHYLAEKIIKESMEHPERNYLVIVPEQATLMTQLKYVALHPRKGLINIDVLSFERLSHRVLGEVGADARTILTDTGKSLIIRSLANDIQDKLKIFGRNFRKHGYVNEMKSLLSEMAQYKVEGEALGEAIRLCEDNPLLRDKLSDMQVIQEAFADKKEDSCVTGEELLERLGRYAGLSGILKGTTLCFDGFTGFTPVQTELLYELLRVSGPAYFTATIDPDLDPFTDRGESDLFRLTTQMCRDIYDIAGRLHIEISESVRVDNESRYKGPDIITLGRSVFRRGIKGVPTEPESISVHQARNPREEVRLAASLIKDYIRKGLRYRDIGIITGSMEEYAPYWESIFTQRGIPFFLDMKRNALNNACVEFIRAAVSLIEERYSYSAMFRFLKTGFVNMEEEDLFLMENYCLATGVRGYKRWHDTWDKPIRGMDEETLIKLNALREELMELMTPYEEAMRKGKATLESRIRALYELMCSLKIEESLIKRASEFRSSGMETLSGEYSQIYGLIMKLFDQMVLLLGEEEISVSELTELMDAGLEEIRIGIIPPGSDQVMIGDMERSRMGQVKVLIFTGFNDGLVPKVSSNTSIINDRDKLYLQDKGIRTSPTQVQKNFIQRFYLYLNLAHPTERLHICYSNVDMGGSTLRHSYYLYEIKRVFPALKVIDEVENEGTRDIAAFPKEGCRYLAENIRRLETDNIWKQLYSSYAFDPALKEPLNLIREGAFKGQNPERLSAKIAEELFGTLITAGVTRLENYQICPYSHFLNYGLGLRERQIFGFEGVDLGNLMHGALCNYGRLLLENNLTWTGVSEESGSELRREAFDLAAGDYGYSVLKSSAEMEYYSLRLRELFDTTVRTLTEQLKMGEYVPIRYELEFGTGKKPGPRVELGNGNELRLKGKIDRLDVARDENRTYVKILDYKTGSKEFDLTGIYEGLDLQLFTYMDSALREVEGLYPGGEIRPGGVLYYHIRDPITEGEESGDGTSSLKELRPDGAVNMSDASLSMFDRNFKDPEYKGGNALKVSRKRDGGFTSASQVLTEEEFETISHHLKEKIAMAGKLMLSGRIEASPVTGLKDGCEYCDYNQICGFDKNIPGCRSRFIRAMDREEVLARMRADNK